MIEQTALVQDLLIGDRSTLDDHEIHNLGNVLDVEKWFATDAETASQWLVEQKPTIVSHFGHWIGVE